MGSSSRGNKDILDVFHLLGGGLARGSAMLTKPGVPEVDGWVVESDGQVVSILVIVDTLGPSLYHSSYSSSGLRQVNNWYLKFPRSEILLRSARDLGP